MQAGCAHGGTVASQPVTGHLPPGALGLPGALRPVSAQAGGFPVTSDDDPDTLRPAHPGIPDIGPVVSSAHLASSSMPALSEVEFALTLANQAFHRCSRNAGAVTA